MHAVGHLPHVWFNDGTVPPHHGIDAIGAHILVFVFHGLAERGSERLGLQTTSEQYVAPIVADTVLPALALGTLPDLVFLAHEHTIVIPVEQVKRIRIRGTIQVHIAALRIDIAGQQLECHPICEIFGIEIFAEDFAHRH